MKEKDKSVLDILIDGSVNGLLILLMLVTVLFILFSLILAYYFPNNPEGFNNFGAAINIISTLFSALALGALFYTIILQQKELRETREEFKNQSVIFQQQRFDDYFRYHLDVHREMKAKFLSLPNPYIGSLVHFRGLLTNYDNKIKEEMSPKEKRDIIEFYVDQFNKDRVVFLSYFNTFTTLLLQIQSKIQILGLDREEYEGIVYSTMEADELKVLLLFSTINPKSWDIFETFGLFNPLTIQHAFNNNKYSNLFEKAPDWEGL